MISCHWSNPVRGDFSAVILDGTNIYKSTPVPGKCPLNYSVPLPVRQLTLNYGGETRVVNSNQLNALMSYADFIFGGCDHLFTGQARRDLHHVIVLDLSRFFPDMFGSSNDGCTPLQVQFNFDYSHLSAGEASGDIDANDKAAFQIYTFLETTVVGECQNGLYHLV